MKIIIIGARGMLGRELARTFSDHKPLEWDLGEIDITDPKMVNERLKQESPDVVINAAAYTAVDDCEEKKELAMSVNGYGPGNLAKACKDIGAKLVHYSTDYIFKGDLPEGYAEDHDRIDPVNVYGQSKALGEKLIKENMDDHYILRTAWLYGKEGKNFVDTMLALAKEKDELSVVNDQFGKPTFAADLAERTRYIIESDNVWPGIYHVTNETNGPVSWYDLARKIFELSGVDIKVRPVASGQFSRPAKRPAYSMLRNTKLPKMRMWDEALEEYLKK